MILPYFFWLALISIFSLGEFQILLHRREDISAANKIFNIIICNKYRIEQDM